MKQKQCTSLPESGGGYSPTSSLDTNQLSLLSGTPTPAKSLESAPQTDGFPACECGKGMSECLIHPSTPEAWTSFMRDSLAKTLASLESRQVYLREPDQVFTEKSCASLAWYDQSSCSWKTYQRSFLTDSEPFLETWPRWGMTVGGSAYVHPMSERRITETDGSYLPTPVASDGTAGGVIGANDTYKETKSGTLRKYNGQGTNGSLGLGRYVQFYPTPTTVDAGTGRFNTSVGSSNARPTLAIMAKKDMWPTPTAHNAKETNAKETNAKETNAKSEMNRNTPTIAAQVGGKLNPTWVEWLMGVPIGFTVSKDWVTPKSRSKPQPRTDCLGDCDAP